MQRRYDIYRVQYRKFSVWLHTNCAERTAIFKAVSEGFREFEAIAIISDSKQPTAPCGVCRQVMAEFCSRDFQVLMLGCEGIQRTASLGELLPYAFSLEK